MRPLTLLGLLTLLTAPAHAQSRSLQDIKQSGTLNILSNFEYEPLMFKSDGARRGFEYELANEIAYRLGLKPNWIEQLWPTLLPSLTRGQGDLVIGSVSVTSTREKEVNFSNAFYCMDSVILTRKNGPMTSKELQGHRISIQPGTIAANFVKKLSNTSPLPATSTPQNIADVVERRAMATIVELVVAQQALQTYPDKNLVVSPALWSTPVAAAFRPDAQGEDLRRAVNTTLKTIIQDGTYQNLQKKYFSTDLRCK